MHAQNGGGPVIAGGPNIALTSGPPQTTYVGEPKLILVVYIGGPNIAVTHVVPYRPQVFGDHKWSPHRPFVLGDQILQSHMWSPTDHKCLGTTSGPPIDHLCWGTKCCNHTNSPPQTTCVGGPPTCTCNSDRTRYTLVAIAFTGISGFLQGFLRHLAPCWC